MTAQPTPFGQRQPRREVLGEVWRAARLGLRGRLPERYDPARLPPGYEGRVWRYPFDLRLAEVAHDGIEILDLGSGCWPTIPPHERPSASRYVGLDISRAELEKAAPGSYDEIVVADLLNLPDELRERFDLVVSWLVFEHLRDVEAGFEAVRACLRRGGAAVVFMSGRNSFPSRINRLVPHSAAKWLLARTLDRGADTVFEAHYDRCTYAGLRGLALGWRMFDIEAFYWAANYLTFSRPLLALALAHEEWLMRTGRSDLASFYLVCAQT